MFINMCVAYITLQNDHQATIIDKSSHDKPLEPSFFGFTLSASELGGVKPLFAGTTGTGGRCGLDCNMISSFKVQNPT